MDVFEARPLKAFKDAKARLRKLLADQALEAARSAKRTSSHATSDGGSSLDFNRIAVSDFAARDDPGVDADRRKRLPREWHVNPVLHDPVVENAEVPR